MLRDFASFREAQGRSEEAARLRQLAQGCIYLLVLLPICRNPVQAIEHRLQLHRVDKVDEEVFKFLSTGCESSLPCLEVSYLLHAKDDSLATT